MQEMKDWVWRLILEVTEDADMNCPYETLVACALCVEGPCLFHRAHANVKRAWFGDVLSELSFHIC